MRWPSSTGGGDAYLGGAGGVLGTGLKGVNVALVTG